MAASARRTPLWAVGLGALLNATGTTRARSAGSGARKDSFFRDRQRTHLRDVADSAPQASRDDGERGRHAAGPTEIPAQGWKDILLRIYRGINDDRILAISAGVGGMKAMFDALNVVYHERESRGFIRLNA